MSGRTPRKLVEDMLERIERIGRCVAELDQAAFVQDETSIDAVVRNLEVIGEAASRMPKDVRASATGIPWQRIIGFRHRIVHAYYDVDEDIVWEIVIRRCPNFVPG